METTLKNYSRKSLSQQGKPIILLQMYATFIDLAPIDSLPLSWQRML
jgi:hypothetical protein